MQNLKLIFRWTKKELWILIIAVAVLFAISYLASFEPLIVGNLYAMLRGEETILPKFLSTFITGSKVTQKIIANCLVLFAIMVFNNIIKQSLYVALNLFGIKVGRNIRNDFYSKLHKIPHEKFLFNEPSGLIQRCINGSDAVSGFMQNNLLSFIESTLRLLFVTLQMAVLAPILVAPIILIMVVMYIGNYIFAVQRSRIMFKEEEMVSHRIRIIKENAKTIRTIKIFNNQQGLLNSYSAINKKYVNVKMRRNLLNIYRRNFIQVCNWVIQAVGFFTIYYMMFIKKQFDMALGIAFFGLFWSFYSWLGTSLGQMLEFGNLTNAVRRLRQVLSAPEHVNTGSLKPELKGKIEFKNVSFKVLGRQILKNENFIIQPGQKAYIYSKNSEEFSILYLLILKFFSDYQGEILLDDININQIDTDFLRSQLGMVEKIPFIFSSLFEKELKESGEITTTELSQKANEILKSAKEESKITEGKKLKAFENLKAKLKKTYTILLLSDLSDILNTDLLNHLLQSEEMKNKTAIICGNFDEKNLQVNFKQEIIQKEEVDV